MTARAWKRHGAAFRSLWLLASISLLMSGCAYPPRNGPLADDARDAKNDVKDAKYDWNARPDDKMPETLIIVSLSGGGTRAAALAMGVLDTMADIPAGSGNSLAEEVDLVSSVSGGSVTAATFAMYGRAGFDRLKKNFLNQDGISEILVDGLNPIGLAALSLPSKERIDLLIDYLDRSLYDNNTFEYFLKNPRHPFLILNAADMVEGMPFPFTQYMMNLLCSDLTSVKISTAVAASAAFPGAFSPVTLKNYSADSSGHCAAAPTPFWVTGTATMPWNDDPARSLLGRNALKYARGDVAYVHLLDGGIADNLGISEPFRLLKTSDVQPQFQLEISEGNIKKVIFISVNARSFKPADLSDRPDTPGIVPMLLASINSAIDRASFATASVVRKHMSDSFVAMAKQLRERKLYDAAKNLDVVAANSVFVSVEFDSIEDAVCREKMQHIATSWTLDKKQVEATEAMGRALLLDSADFAKALGLAGASPRPDRTGHVKEVCNSLPSAW